MSHIKILFIILFVPFSFSLKCKDEAFSQILVNNQNYYEISPDWELCYQYTLSKTKKSIIFSFLKVNSTSAEVILYK